ncbi:PAAR domain-containing protein [Massilia sp. YMA4]|uniref:PAAR domain-containing protein n=1 Tax=[Empedobacter] haloabium TaxID=592317 RepID=A0ABZ1UE80_9BURK|nr:PAAR domain-containing protein [Massilia sp. YMA4]AXA90611.1 PAAR domain-containing protein [Massilia sp. YMA4]
MTIIGWIRQGDAASCGGTVKEGHPHYTSHGKPLAYHGSPIACRKNCLVVAGDHHFTLPDGLPQALHGDKSSNGCPLASTLNGIHGVDDPSGAPPATAWFQPAAAALAATAAPEALERVLDEAPWVPGQYDDRYVLVGASDGEPLAHTDYAIEREDGSIEHGTTDAEGHTHLLKQTLEQEHVRIYLAEDA